MKEIALTQGKVALVDDDDYEWLSQFVWHLDRATGRQHTQYAVTSYRVNGRVWNVLMHRMMLNAPADRMVDHRNHNGLDNRRSNLRLCTNAENQHNQSKRVSSASRFKGVRKNGHRWRACIKVENNEVSLGTFVTEEEAAMAYNSAARRYYGEFACCNVV